MLCDGEASPIILSSTGPMDRFVSVAVLGRVDSCSESTEVRLFVNFRELITCRFGSLSLKLPRAVTGGSKLPLLTKTLALRSSIPTTSFLKERPPYN